MSDLKAYRFLGRDEVCPDANLGSDYYLKSEADNVIADKDKKIAELEADYKEACYYLQTTNLIKDEQLAVIRRHKYKRCLAMASKCRLRARWFGDNAFYKKEQWALQWHRRWLQLAEKFKETRHE